MSVLHDLLNQSAETIGLAAAIIVGLTAIWAKGIVPLWRKAKRAVRTVQRVTVAADRLLDYAEKELRPNGGGSLYDKVTRIDERFEVAQAHRDRLEDSLVKLTETVDGHHRDVTTRLQAIEERQ